MLFYFIMSSVVNCMDIKYTVFVLVPLTLVGFILQLKFMAADDHNRFNDHPSSIT